MAGEVLNIKAYSPLKLRSGLTGNYHAICHYSYNLPLAHIKSDTARSIKIDFFGTIQILFSYFHFTDFEKRQSKFAHNYF